MAKPFEDFGLGPEENREFGFSQEGIFYLPLKRYPDSADAERHMAEEFETVAGDWEWRVVSEVFLSPDESTGEAYWIESDPNQELRDPGMALGRCQAATHRHRK